MKIALFSHEFSICPKPLIKTADLGTGSKNQSVLSLWHKGGPQISPKFWPTSFAFNVKKLTDWKNHSYFSLLGTIASFLEKLTEHFQSKPLKSDSRQTDFMFVACYVWDKFKLWTKLLHEFSLFEKRFRKIFRCLKAARVLSKRIR